MRVFLAAVILVGICVVMLSVGIIFKRGFPQYDVGGNEKLKAMGITCFKDEDARIRRSKPRGCDGNFTDACEGCGFYKSEKGKS